MDDAANNLLAKTSRLQLPQQRETRVVYCCVCTTVAVRGREADNLHDWSASSPEGWCVRRRLQRSFGQARLHRCLWTGRCDTQKKTMFSPKLMSVLQDSGNDGKGPNTPTLFFALPHPALTSDNARSKKCRRMPVAATRNKRALDVWDWREVAWGLGPTARKYAEKKQKKNSNKTGCGVRGEIEELTNFGRRYYCGQSVKMSPLNKGSSCLVALAGAQQSSVAVRFGIAWTQINRRPGAGAGDKGRY